MKLSSLTYGLTLGVAINLLAPAAHGASLKIEPSTSSIAKNSNFFVNISIESIVDLYAFQFDFDFTPNLLTVSKILPGSFLSGGAEFLPGFIDNEAGKISFIGDTLIGSVSGKTGSGVLATIEFNSVSPGIANLSVENPIFLNSSLQDINGVNTQIGSVQIIGITTTPEPSFLAAFGIITASFLGRLCSNNLQQRR